MHFVRSKIASPFQLEKPVNPINFAGRQTVLKNIRQMVGNMLVGSPSQALLCGQSGMGKTSLLHYLRNTYSQKKLLVIDIENPVSTSDFIIQIVEVILKKSVKEPHYMKIRGLFEDSIIADKSEKEIYDLKDNKLIPRNDLKFMPDYDELEYLKGNFHEILKEVSSLLRLSKGMIITVDDIDYLTEDNEFIKWYADFGFNLNGLDDARVAVFLTIKPDYLSELYLANPDFKKIFKVYGLNQLLYKEVEVFYKNIFSRLKIKISSKSISKMAKASKGIPFLMEEIGDAVYWNCDGIVISEQDVDTGIVDAGKITFSYQIRDEIAEYSK